MALTPLAATLMDLPASVANKRLTTWLTPLDATLTENRGVHGLSSHPPTCQGTAIPAIASVIIIFSEG